MTIRAWRTTVLVDKPVKAFHRLSAVVLLIGAFIFGAPIRAQADPCPNGQLAAGAGEDIVINRPCTARAGTFHYGNINIVAKGSLVFEEKENVWGEKIDIWAKSILVENGGSLLTHSAGVVSPYDAEFGIRGGVLTIHLYGADQGVKGKGVTCKSPAIDPNGRPSRDGQCGIPNEVWDTNGKQKVSLPGQQEKDYFDQYAPLPFDNGEEKGYFGYKVIAVSYGGILKLHGAKGVSGDLLQPVASGTSWVRLDGTITPDAKSLNVRPITWAVGDHIVVTTTDYLPNHSEELVICKIDEINGRQGAKITFTTDLTADPIKDKTCPQKGIKWSHNGEPYKLFDRLPSRLNIGKSVAETRAAVGLLTRSVRIVSEGDTFGNCFPPSVKDPSKGCSIDDRRTNYYFGGHTIARQGFLKFQVEGVEFRQLGQGGKLGHYPVHFHMARHTPPDTYVRDSSINESMTRWITVHATQDLTIQRNVGWRSIGHGFYLEDGVETDNNFYSNLGIFARAAIANDSNTPNPENPRRVPGILAAAPNEDTPGLMNRHAAYDSDRDAPAVFWITNGWNDFRGNMAAGAGMCGVCFWEVPAAISGGSRSKTWESYASGQTSGREGSSPLKNFDGNYCTSAMMSFQTVGNPPACAAVGDPQNLSVPVVNPYAPASTAANIQPPFPSKKRCGPDGSNPNWPICPEDYYPNLTGDAGKATICPATGPCSQATAPLCATGSQTNCLPSVINNYTTSFNYSDYNDAAVWLRGRWYLFANGFVSDVQNAGLTFVGGGDYTHSSAIPGLWNLALQTVFVGQTHDPSDPNWGYASVLSPFNEVSRLSCDKAGSSPCTSVNNSFTLPTFAAFGVSEHMFNIYDGPADENSSAYLDIMKTDLKAVNSNKSVYKSQLGIPKAVKLDPQDQNPIPIDNCYIQNAAIAWKQQNGFYYPPTFHSENLFFDRTDIRHYVIDPWFQFSPVSPETYPGTYLTDTAEAAKRYCQQNQNNGLFTGFKAVDRQTVLTDDDGSLTGYQKTISVNEDKFFTAPVEGVECRSDGATPEAGTARISPYEYVTTVVYPDDAQNAQTPGDFGRVCWKDPNPDPKRGPHPDPNWDSDCANETCFGVPLYRLYQTGTEQAAKKPPEFIRMSVSNFCQRETMTVNHGLFLFDLTAKPPTQNDFYASYPPPGPPDRPVRKNIFVAGKTYDFFLVFAKASTHQTYKMYVGDAFKKDENVKLVRVDLATAPLKIRPESVIKRDGVLKVSYENPILTVEIDLDAYKDDFAKAAKDLCQPRDSSKDPSTANSFCAWNGSKCVGSTNPVIGGNLSQSERDIACSYAGKDIDCPAGGCVGFSVTLPLGFEANDQTVSQNLPAQLAQCFPKFLADKKTPSPWNVTFKPAAEGLAGACLNPPTTTDFCQQ